MPDFDLDERLEAQKRASLAIMPYIVLALIAGFLVMNCINTRRLEREQQLNMQQRGERSTR